jgi:GR25 family glycosyltransferase involved in LPS biosynthesis
MALSKENYQFYCLSFNNPVRKANMERRFKTAGIDCIMYEGVPPEDNRIEKLGRGHIQTIWSCMYGHLDMISDFVQNTEKEFGIFCEDDIYIHKDLKKLMPQIMKDFNHLQLDVLLLGYLLHFRVEKNNGYPEYALKNPLDNSSPSCDSEIYSYHNYPDGVWGTQMYMLSRTSAKTLLNKYDFSSGYAERTLHDPTLVPFTADWTITKDGNRALITPILAVEDNQTNYEHEGQRNFHRACFDNHFVSELFIT